MTIFIFAKTSVRLYIGPDNCSVFVFRSVYVSSNSVRRKYPVSFKCGLNTDVLFKSRSIDFGVHCPNIVCTRMHKRISLHFGLWKEMYLYFSCERVMRQWSMWKQLLPDFEQFFYDIKYIIYCNEALFQEQSTAQKRN